MSKVKVKAIDEDDEDLPAYPRVEMIAFIVIMLLFAVMFIMEGHIK